MQVNGVGCSCPGPNCGCQDHGLGNAIILSHKRQDGSTFYTLYAHNASFASNLTVGQAVDKGTVIATKGGSGYGLPNYWGTHSHFEVKSAAVLGNPTGSGAYFGYTPADPASYGYFDPAQYINIVSVQASGICVGCGAPSSSIATTFQSAYNLEASTLGNPTGTVQYYNDTFYSPAISGYYQNFPNNMSLQLLTGASRAFSVKFGFANLYSAVAAYKSPAYHVYDLVVAPAANESSAGAASVAGTKYTSQPFIKGSMYYFNSGGFANQGWLNQAQYVWGEFSDRFSRDGGPTGPMGLPVSDTISYGLYSGFNYWYQWFERGFIWRAQSSSGGPIWTYGYHKTADVTTSNGQWIDSALGWVQH
jgi:hypothetical protein